MGAAVLGLACIGLLLMALSDNAFGLLDDPGDDAGTYFAVFALVFGDAMVAIFPGETTLNTASVLASDGELELGLVIIAGFLGAWLGDNVLYWVVRSVPGFHSRVEKAQEDERFKRIAEIVTQSSFVLVIVCRFLPFVRWAVIAGMGALPMPYGRSFSRRPSGPSSGRRIPASWHTSSAPHSRTSRSLPWRWPVPVRRFSSGSDTRSGDAFARWRLKARS